MTESCVQEMRLPNPELKSFIREIESKHGEILSLRDLCARDQKLGNEVILGVVDSVFPVIKKGDGQLQVIRLYEVTINGHRGQLFSVYAYSKFATSLTDARLHEGDFAAFCSACIREGCHRLEAHIGIPEYPSGKIFFLRKPHMTDAGTSKRQGSSTICESLGMSLEQHETTNRVRSSASYTETSHNSSVISPGPPILTLSSPSTSSSGNNQIQHALDDGAVSSQRTRNECTYKKLSELMEPDKRVNIYGVIRTMVKVPREDNKHAVLRLRDETCGPDEEFLVHIFFNRETAFPKLEHGYILRLQRLKTELFDGVLDGRVFSATDVVTFPPDGQGTEHAFTTSTCLNFSDSDTERLTELRRWIGSQNQQQPLPFVPVTSNTTLRPVRSSEPSRALLSEIKKEGNYVLLCKVLDVHIFSDEMRSFTVTDGTFFVDNFYFAEYEWHVTREVKILVVDPSPLLKKIRTGALVELTNVTVHATLVPTSIDNWPCLSLKLNGNNCSVKIFKGFESEAIKLKR